MGNQRPFWYYFWYNGHSRDCSGAEVEALRWLMCMGFGITMYGVSYFIFHDVIVHRRIKIKFKTQNRYLNRIIRAHYVHHKVHEREGAEAFGFLYAPKKYEKDMKA
ncbi:MAG: hypothetical protein R2822_20350 [Spirosomataceae bacterium]